jgi:hypothetical protein
MKSFTVTCPSCSSEFEPIEAQAKFLEKEVEAALAKSKAQLTQKQKELQDREAAIKASEDEIATKVEAALKVKLADAEKKAQTEQAKKFELKLADLENQLKEKDQVAKTSTKQQLELTRQLRELTERQQSVDLEVEQKVMDKLEDVQKDAVARADDLYKLQLAQRDKKIKDIEQQLETARRTAEQGSQQSQGEVAEIEFEKALAAKFPLDKFEPVPKGVDGADLIQKVVNSAARPCGSIIWEIKNTKNFKEDWISKLKIDQQRVNADVAVLVTKALPKGAQDIELMDGVLVVSYELAIALSGVVRKSIEDLSYTQLVSQGQDEKMRIIYNYLTGTQFKTKVKAIVSAFKSLKEDLEAEKRALKRIWTSREKLLDQVIDSASSMYGDIEGIAGSAAPKIEELEFPQAALIEQTKEPAEA